MTLDLVGQQRLFTDQMADTIASITKNAGVTKGFGTKMTTLAGLATTSLADSMTLDLVGQQRLFTDQMADTIASIMAAHDRHGLRAATGANDLVTVDSDTATVTRVEAAQGAGRAAFAAAVAVLVFLKMLELHWTRPEWDWWFAVAGVSPMTAYRVGLWLFDAWDAEGR